MAPQRHPCLTGITGRGSVAANDRDGAAAKHAGPSSRWGSAFQAGGAAPEPWLWALPLVGGAPLPEALDVVRRRVN